MFQSVNFKAYSAISDIYIFRSKSSPNNQDCFDSIPAGIIQSSCKYQDCFVSSYLINLFFPLSFLIPLKHFHFPFIPRSLFSFPAAHIIYTIWKCSAILGCAMNFKTDSFFLSYKYTFMYCLLVSTSTPALYICSINQRLNKCKFTERRMNGYPSMRF